MRRRVRLWTLVWLLLTTLGDVGGAQQVRVARGFFTFIQPSDVTISRSSTATHCKISVDTTDLTTLQVGTVHPNVRLTSSSDFVPCPSIIGVGDVGTGAFAFPQN